MHYCMPSLASWLLRTSETEFMCLCAGCEAGMGERIPGHWGALATHQGVPVMRRGRTLMHYLSMCFSLVSRLLYKPLPYDSALV